jgi:hypothetical protein
MLLADILKENMQKFSLFIDNQSAIELSKNPVFHDRSKHIDTRNPHYFNKGIECRNSCGSCAAAKCFFPKSENPYLRVFQEHNAPFAAAAF